MSLGLGLGLSMASSGRKQAGIAAFKAALAATLTGTSHTIIATPGSSIFTGANGNPVADNITNAFEGNWQKYLADDLIAATYVVNRDSLWSCSGLNDPATFALYNTRAVPGAGWVATGNSSVGGPYWRNNTTTNAFVYTPVLNCNQIDLYFPGGSGITGTVSYSVDGGAATNVVLSGADRIVKVSIPLTLGAHVVSIARVSGLVALIGIDCYDTTIGQVRIWNLGWSSTTTAEYAGASFAAAPANMLAYLAPQIDLLVLALGINDWSTPLTGAYLTNLSTVGNAGTSAGASLIVIGDHNITAGAATNRTAYNAVAQGYAASKAAPYIDQGLNLGTLSQAQAAGYMSSDNVHLRTLGFRRYANPISDLALAP